MGKTSIYAFSFIVSGLVIVSFGCFAVFSGKVIKNKLVWVITFFSIIYTLVVSRFKFTTSVYLQYVPHRILFPSIILVYMLLYFKLRNKKYKTLWQLLGFVISALAIFWNLETGFIVLALWILFLGYEVLFFYKTKDKKVYKEIVKIILMICFAILIFFIILNLITFTRTGNLISLKNIIFGQSIFSGSGFFMVKMNILHPWILLVIVYAIALCTSIKNLKFMNKTDGDKQCYEKSSIIFALSILGMGIFAYYQGRSMDDTFYRVLYPGIILIGIFLDFILSNNSKETKIYKFYNWSYIIIFISILTILGTSAIYYSITDIRVNYVFEKEFIKEYNIIDEEIELAKKIKDIFDEVDFIMPSGIYYYESLGIADKRKFNEYVDLFKFEDYKKVIDYMKENDVTICANKTKYKVFEKRYKEEIAELLDNKYKYVEIGNYVFFVNEKNWKNIDKLNEMQETIKNIDVKTY